MLFKEMTGQSLIATLRAKNILSAKMWGNPFHTIITEQEKEMLLKNKFKPVGKKGPATEYLENTRADQDLVKKARDKMQKAQFVGKEYDNTEGSLKLHLSLNKIGDIEESVLLGLIELLKKEAEDPKNNLSFYFKIIGPDMHDHERFRMNDQLTLYFDKYSSLGDMLRLGTKVDEYLQKHIKPNTQELGPKDNFGINSFVSARFDTNKLLELYDVHPFFDLQLKKFVSIHPDDLNDLPICALEAVFNTIITSKDINISKTKDLSAEDSVKVQAEFEKVLKDPAGYMSGYLKQARKESAQDKEKELVVLGKIEQHFKNAREINVTFDLSQDLKTLNLQIAKTKAQFDAITKDPNLENDFKGVDAKVFSDFGELMQQKEKDFNEIIEQVINQSKEVSAAELIRNKQRPLTLTQAYRHPKPQLNSQAVMNFETILEKLNKKSIQLGSNEKALFARALYNKVDIAYKEYKAGTLAYTEFVAECDTAIKASLPKLGKHRGFKEILVNLWEAIKSFGTSIYKEYKRTEGKQYFFNVPTESSELAQKLDEAMKGLGEKPPKNP